MCGRYALTTEPGKLAKRFGAEPPAGLRARYNVAPSQDIPILRREREGRRFALARWGLVPSWSKEAKSGYRTINARAETVASKPAFRSAFRHRRCLIPASGFYEWQAQAHTQMKQPWFVALKNGEPMGFAGLWEHWKGAEGEELESCCILVTEANELMRPIHDRMPVILDPESWDAWLDPEVKDPSFLRALLTPVPAETMTTWPVGTAVNNPRHDAPDCLERLD
jgi:putative SOS response-associated peptidase YedK